MKSTGPPTTPLFSCRSTQGFYSEPFQEPAALEGIPIPLRFTARFTLEDILNGASLIGGLVDPNAGSEAVNAMVSGYHEAKAVSVTQQGNQFTVTMTFATPALANHPAPPAVGQVNPAQVSMAHEYPRGLVVIGHIQTNPDKPAVALPETIHIPLEQRLRLREAERQGEQILRHATAANDRDMFVARLHDHGYTVVDGPRLIPATPPWVHVEYQADGYNVAAPAVSYATTIESQDYRFQVTMTWPDPNQWDSDQYHGKPGPTW